MKVFKIDIDLLDDLSGVDFNSFVESPAHYKNFQAFNKHQAKKQLFVNDEKRIVRGVMISANQSIPRYDKELGKFYVYFGIETIDKIIEKFFKSQNTSKVNIEHNPMEVAEGVFMKESYQVDGKVHLPDPTIGSKIGDWVAAYKVDNKEIWNKIKEGSINGFSVEGFFSHLERKLKTSNNKKQKMNKKKTTFSALLAGFKEVFASEESFAEVTTDAGIVLSYEGALEAGTALMITDAESEESTSAPEGVYALAGDDAGKSLVVDASGIITEIIEDSAEDAEEAIEEAVAEVMSAMVEMKKEVLELKAQVSNFSATPAEEPAKRVVLTKAAKVAELRLAALKEKIGK